MECGEKWEHETAGQAADIDDRVIPQCLGLSLCLWEQGPAAWAWGTKLVLHEGQAGVSLQEPELDFPGA